MPSGRLHKYGEKIYPVQLGLVKAELDRLDAAKDPRIPRAAFLRDLVLDALARLEQSEQEQKALS